MSTTKNEGLELFRRYKKKTGSEMPAEIVAMGVERMKRAVEFVEQFENVTAAAPPSYSPQTTTEPVEESLVEWDKASEF